MAHFEATWDNERGAFVYDPAEYGTDTTYGPDFDPIERFDAIDPADFAVFDDHLCVVGSGGKVWSLPEWRCLVDGGRVKREYFRPANPNKVASTLDDPVAAYRRFARTDPNERSGTAEVCGQLASALTERVARDEPQL